jgi:putative hydrolase of the HAD superfamily
MNGMRTTILLDAGGVILDERRYEAETRDTIVSILNASKGNYSKTDYDSDLEESIAVFSPHNRRYVFWKHCGGDRELFEAYWKQFKKKWDSMDHGLVLMKGIGKELEDLAHDYKLVLACQYGKTIIDILRKNDLMRLFANELSQDDFPITKPDPRYLALICARANIDPGDCVMIGDRIDKDMIPAKQNKMGTVFIKSGVYKNQKARTPDEIPDLTVDSVIGLSRKVKETFV